MDGLRSSAKFRALTAQITEVLTGRGLDVMPAVITDVLESGAQRVAEQLGVTPLTALKYADPETLTAGRAADPLTELGLALLTSHGAAIITVEHGCLIEAAGVLEHAASRIAAGRWSQCLCGTDHGQAALDAKVAPAMRDDAAFARMVAGRSPDDAADPAAIVKSAGRSDGGDPRSNAPHGPVHDPPPV